VLITPPEKNYCGQRSANLEKFSDFYTIYTLYIKGSKMSREVLPVLDLAVLTLIQAHTSKNNLGLKAIVSRKAPPLLEAFDPVSCKGAA
jgi:hypothetical protein